MTMNQHKKSTEHTVFVRFVPPSSLLRRHHMEDHFSQIGPIKKASLIIPKKEDSSSSYGFIKYTCESDAKNAAQQLHKSTLTLPEVDQQAHAPHSFQVMVELASLQMKKQQQQQQEKKEEPKETSGGISEHQKKHNRVILRNLSFYAKESHIRSALEKYGKLVDIHIPLVKGKSRGFAFCTFATAMSCQKAIQASGIVVASRPVKVEFSVPKKVHQQQQEEEQKMKRKQDYREKVKQDLKRTNQRQKDEKEEKKEEEEANEDTSEDDDDSSSSDEDSNSDSEDGDDSEKDSEEDSDDDDEEDSEDDEDEHETNNNLQLAVQEQRELFVRNLPFDATRHDVFEAFRTHGKIQAIYIVTDHITKLPRGTAFVTYEKQTGAARAMKKISATPLSLKGRPLTVDYAVDKETALTLKKDASVHAQNHMKDKRNLYLKTEGRVDDDQAWAQLSESDKLKRQKAWSDKHTKLKSPLFFLNAHRLSIRNLSKGVDEAALKRLLFQAAQSGLQKGLVGLPDLVAQWRATGEQTQREILERSKEYTPQGGMKDDENPLQLASLDERNTKRTIPSVFLDRDFEVRNKKSGNDNDNKAPSRGFAFAEFTHHVQALACLRELNNNPAYSEEFAAGGKAAATAAAQKRKAKKKQKKKKEEEEDQVVRLPRLIVEFTVENKAKAKQQNERRAHQQAHRVKQKLETKEKREQQESKKKSASKTRGRGARQREKKRQRKEEGNDEVVEETQVPSKKPSKRSREEEEENKPKAIKPPKKLNKRQRDDKETDENFSKLVNKYKTAFQDALGGKMKKKTEAAPNPRKEALAEGKRWYE